MRTGSNRNARRRPARTKQVERGSGNVYEDLGLPDSAGLLAKAGIALRISAIIERRALTQSKAAELLGIHQADVSDLVRGKLQGFSTDRLLRFLMALGQDVEIVLPPRLHRRRGRLRVSNEPSARLMSSRQRK